MTTYTRSLIAVAVPMFELDNPPEDGDQLTATVYLTPPHEGVDEAGAVELGLDYIGGLTPTLGQLAAMPVPHWCGVVTWGSTEADLEAIGRATLRSEGVAHEDTAKLLFVRDTHIETEPAEGMGRV